MKKLITIIGFMALATSLSAQYYYKGHSQKRDLSYQVGLDVVTTPTHALYGFHIGVNHKEVLDLSYINVRDYGDREESWMDNSLSGLYGSAMIPLSENWQAGPFGMYHNINGERQKTVFGAEVRLKLFWNSKVALFYGKGAEQMGGFRVIWNLY